MAGVAFALTLEASFHDLDSNVLNSSYQLVVPVGEQTPFTVKRVFLKAEVPCGAEFEVVLRAEGAGGAAGEAGRQKPKDADLARYRGLIPLPLEAQELLTRFYHNAGLNLGHADRLSLQPLKTAEFKREMQAAGEFEADIYAVFRGQENGFIEYEFQVGQAGVSTSKFTLRNQFWLRMQ